MSNYFRIAAYHPTENVSAIFDSNGRFEKLWQFSSFLIQRDFKIIEVGADDKFLEGDVPKVPEGKALFLRACSKSAPQRNVTPITAHGKTYEVNTQ